MNSVTDWKPVWILECWWRLPDNALARRFRDEAGWLNQAVAGIWLNFLRAKRTPRGKRGIRVIVVVACSVLTSAARLCWIIVVFIRYFSTSNGYYSSWFASSGFDVCVQISKTTTACKNLFLCAPKIKQFPCHIAKKALKTTMKVD